MIMQFKHFEQLTAQVLTANQQLFAYKKAKQDVVKTKRNLLKIKSIIETLTNHQALEDQQQKLRKKIIDQVRFPLLLNKFIQDNKLDANLNTNKSLVFLSALKQPLLDVDLPFTEFAWLAAHQIKTCGNQILKTINHKEFQLTDVLIQAKKILAFKLAQLDQAVVQNISEFYASQDIVAADKGCITYRCDDGLLYLKACYGVYNQPSKKINNPIALPQKLEIRLLQQEIALISNFFAVEQQFKQSCLKVVAALKHSATVDKKIKNWLDPLLPLKEETKVIQLSYSKFYVGYCYLHNSDPNECYPMRSHPEPLDLIDIKTKETAIQQQLISACNQKEDTINGLLIKANTTIDKLNKNFLNHVPNGDIKPLKSMFKQKDLARTAVVDTLCSIIPGANHERLKTQIFDKLKHYTRRIEDNKIDNKINFSAGFWPFVSKFMAENRKINYRIAKSLTDTLYDSTLEQEPKALLSALLAICDLSAADVIDSRSKKSAHVIRSAELLTIIKFIKVAIQDIATSDSQKVTAKLSF